MSVKRLWHSLSLLIVFSMLLAACGPQPTPTTRPPTVEPTAEPDATPTRSPLDIPIVSDSAPAVVQQSPAPGAELALDGAVELVFNQPMDRAAVEDAFHIEPQVSGSFSWADDRTVSFAPAESLPRGGQFQVALDSSALAQNGAPLNDAYRFQFAAVGYLQVTQVLPAVDAQDVEPGSTITVIFNRPVVPLTSLSEQDTLPQPLTLDPPVAGRGEWLNTSIYVFSPDQPLIGGTTYTAQIAAGLSDTTGGVLAEDVTWTFTTRPPVVVWNVPSENQDLVPVTQAITVTFNQPMDPASVGSSLAVWGENGQRVAGLIGVNQEVVTFTPEEQLAFDATYRVDIAAGVLSRGGRVGMEAPYSWKFSTVPLPQILRTEPADGDQDASPYTDFVIYFNAPIDPATVMPNIRMTPTLEASEVYTYFSQWDNSFSIGFGAEPSTDYRVEIGPNIADPYGNQTGQELAVSFRTAALDPMVQLRVPDMVGTYNAYDPARLVVSHLNVTRLQFELYRLSPQRFFDLQRRWEWDEFKPDQADLIRSWEQPVENVLNQTAYESIDLVEDGGRLEPGLYYLSLDAPEVDENYNWYGWSRHVLMVSQLNLTVKRSEEQLLVWATDLASGEPVADLALDLRTEDDNQLGTLTTGMDGAALTDSLPRYTDSLWLLSEGDPFVMGSEYWQRGIDPWEFGLGDGEWAQDTRVYVYTDRPIYRPDHTVHFRGIARAEDDARYSAASSRQVEVTIRDPNWDEVFRQTLTLSDYGTFYGDLELAAGAPLGDYTIEVKLGGDTFGQNFQVAAYRTPQYKVVVTPSQDEIVGGQGVQAAVEVATFFGSPVVGASVEWNVLAERLDFQGIGNYSFSDNDDPWVFYRWWGDDSAEFSEPILSGSGSTDAQGRLMIDVPADLLSDLAADEGSQTLTIEATVYGPDNSVISGRGSLALHQGDYYVGVAPQVYVSRAGDEVAIDLIALDWHNQRLPDTDITVELYRRDYENTFVESEVGGYWEWQQNDVLVDSNSATTGPQGEAEVLVTPPEGGTYRVVASSVDAGGRTVRSSAFFWATSPETISWQRNNNDRINLVTDRLSYAPGDTAEILIPSPFEGRQIALISVERANVKEYEVVEMESNSYVYRLPITADYAPNIYVSAVIIKGQDATSPLADYRVGYAALEVETSQQELTVSVTPGTEQASPGETVEYTIQVTDSSGEPVAGECSLDLVDKGVLTLRPRTANAIVQAFYGRRALGVRTASGLSVSVNRLVEEQQDEMETFGRGAAGMAVAEEQSLDTGAAAPALEMPMWDESTNGAKSAAHGPAGVEVRQEFADTAYWNSSLVTDQTGRATVTLTLPDNLTTWTARAVGLNAATQVGEGIVDLQSTMPVLIRPVTPRFFVVEDRAQVAALVNNNTDQELLIDVTLDVAGVSLEDPAAAGRQITVPAHGETKVTWWVIAKDVEYADLVFSAVSGDYADASRPTLATGPNQTIPIYRYTAPEVVGTAGQLAEAGSLTEVVALPPLFDDRQGELRVEIDPSLAAGMQAGLDYLEHYEYECIEQTVSRFLPNVLTLRSLRELGIEKPELEAKLQEQLAIGLQRIYLAQNGDGGWGWWPNKESNAYVSAYVVFALVKAAELGYEVTDDVINRGASYLETQLVAPRELRSYREANQQAWLLFVLTEHGGRDQSAELDALYQSREKLSHYGRAYLAMALGRDDNRAPTLLSDLNNAAILSATGAHWEESDYDWWAMNTDTRSTAIILNALTRLDPENAFIPNVVRWLMVARQEGIWETTQETAWALIALTDWMAYTGELAADYDWAVWLNDEEWSSGAATSENVDQPIIMTRALAELLREQGNALTIARGEGSGRLYYTAHMQSYLPVEAVEAANRGIIVSRQYTRIDCDEGVGCPSVEQAQVGDEIRVKLTIIAPNSLYYLVVEDPLPAGAEAIDTSLATTSLLAEGPNLQRQSERDTWWDWWWNWYSHSEMRDEKVVLFADYVAAGTYEYTYTFRATTPGEFRVMPTFASEFYFPEVFGRTEGSLFVIEE